jgi:mRNA-degrading endonuclease RelE of RelBE toxin-antitoxin system
MEGTGKWRVEFSTAAKKQKRKLPEAITSQLASLAWDLEHDGPVQRDCSHYSPLKKGKNIPPNAHHCHIKNGRPTYVVCWQVIDKTIKFIEIYYVGTHENAPY